MFNNLRVMKGIFRKNNLRVLGYACAEGDVIHWKNNYADHK